MPSVFFVRSTWSTWSLGRFCDVQEPYNNNGLKSQTWPNARKSIAGAFQKNYLHTPRLMAKRLSRRWPTPKISAGCSRCADTLGICSAPAKKENQARMHKNHPEPLPNIAHLADESSLCPHTGIDLHHRWRNLRSTWVCTDQGHVMWFVDSCQEWLRLAGITLDYRWKVKGKVHLICPILCRAPPCCVFFSVRPCAPLRRLVVLHGV